MRSRGAAASRMPTTSWPRGRSVRRHRPDHPQAHRCRTPAPIIVVATIALGGFIGAEATLSFLGIGLQPPVVSWGIMISDGPELRPRRAVPAVLPGRRSSSSPCWRSSCSATRSATPSTRSCAEGRADVTVRRRLRDSSRQAPGPRAGRRRPPAGPRCSRSTTCTSSSAPATASPRPSTASSYTSTRARPSPCSASPAPASPSPRRRIMGILDTPPGLRSPSGEIRFRGQDMLRCPSEERRQIRGREDRDDLPGRAVRAEPGLHRRLPDRRDVPGAPRACRKKDGEASAPSS